MPQPRPGPLHGAPGEGPPLSPGKALLLDLQKEGLEVGGLQMGPAPSLQGEPAHPVAQVQGPSPVRLLAVPDQVGPVGLLQDPSSQRAKASPTTRLRSSGWSQISSPSPSLILSTILPAPPPPTATSPHLHSSPALPANLFPVSNALPVQAPSPLGSKWAGVGEGEARK